MGGKSSSAGKAKDYYGSIAGLICLGPLQAISGLVVDGALVWPDAPEWPEGKSYLKSTRIGRGGGIANLTCLTPHGFKVGDLFATENFTAPNFNQAPGTVSGIEDRFQFYFWAAGPDLVQIDYTDGYVFPAVPMVVGDLRRVGAVVYECVLNHNTTPDTKPPNATYWKRFRVDRTDAGVGNPFKLTVPDHGDAYVYWGTDTQTLDATNEQLLASSGHPAYRNQAVMVLRKFLFGRERATAPNVQVIGWRTPAQTIITGDAAALDVDGQANPIACVAELISHPIWGVGFTLLNATSWQATADWALANSALTYCSPLVTRQESVRSLIPKFLEAAGCWTRWNAAGEIEIGHWPLNEAAPAFTADTTVDYNDLLDGEEAEGKSDLWDGTANHVTITYADAERAFKDRPAAAADILNRDVTGRTVERAVDRPHITRGVQALALAQHELKLATVPALAGPAKVRAEKATSIQPGDLFLLTHDAIGTSMVVRCTERTDDPPPAARVELQYETERGISDTPYMPTPDSPLPAPKPRPVQPADVQLVQLPSSLAGADFCLAALVARLNGVTNRIDLWFQQADTGAFQDLGSQTGFAVAATVNASFAIYTDGGTALIPDDDTKHVSLLLGDHTPDADLDQLLASQTDDQVNDNARLLFLFKASAPAQFEILTVKSITAAGAGVYNLVVRRSRFGTKQGGDDSYTWAVADRAFLVARSAIVPFTHTRFPALATAATTATFRIVPSSAWSSGAVAYVYDPSTNPGGLTLELSFTFTDPFPPTVSFISLTHVGSAVNFATTYTTTDTFTIQVQFGSPLSDMSAATIWARLGSTDVVIWSGIPTEGKSSALITPVPAFSLAPEGDWRLMAGLVTTAGRNAAATLQDSGSDAALQVRAPGSTTVLPPTATPHGFTGIYTTKTVTLSCATSGATIHYQIVDALAPAGGSWTTYSGAITVGINKSVYAYASKSGLTDSAAQRWDFDYESGR